MKSTTQASLPASRKGEITFREASPTELDTRLQLIQMLIPVALERVEEMLQQELNELAGRRYARYDDHRDHIVFIMQRVSGLFL